MNIPMNFATTWKRLWWAAGLLFLLAATARAQDVDATAMIRGGLQVIQMIDTGNTGELWDGAAPGVGPEEGGEEMRASGNEEINEHSSEGMRCRSARSVVDPGRGRRRARGGGWRQRHALCGLSLRMHAARSARATCGHTLCARGPRHG